MMLNKRSFVALLLIMALAWSTSSVSAQTPGITTVYINDQPVKTTAILQNGYQLIPASFFRNVNASVVWNAPQRTAMLKTPAMELGFPIGERYTQYRRSASAGWQQDSLQLRTVLLNGTTYVPLAYTARKLGMAVQYDTQKRAAIISTGDGNFVSMAKQDGPTSEELHWLYQITEAEAGGESYTSKVAVAASILNRVSSPEWPNSIIETIFQVDYYHGKAYYQYSPVLDKRIYQVKPSQETKRAVQEALNGTDPSRGATVFYNPKKTDNEWVRSRPVTVRLGNHVFAK